MLTATPAPNLVFSTTSVPVGPSKRLVAQTALLHLLSTNLDMFSTFVDQCYATDPSVSRAYFQVAAQLSCTHILLHLSLLSCVKRLSLLSLSRLLLLNMNVSEIWDV